MLLLFGTPAVVRGELLKCLHEVEADPHEGRYAKESGKGDLQEQTPTFERVGPCTKLFCFWQQLHT